MTTASTNYHSAIYKSVVETRFGARADAWIKVQDRLVFAWSKPVSLGFVEVFGLIF